MKVPDNLLLTYFNLTTDLDENIYKPLCENDIIKAHKLYAETIVTLYHGKEYIDAAEQRYKNIASGGAPEEMDEFTIDKDTRLIDLLSKSGLAPSNSEARRLITGGGVKIDGEQIKDTNKVFSETGEFVVSKGKNKFIKAIVK